MHNQRELMHMEDVKQLLGLIRWVWAGLIGLVILLSVVQWRIGSAQALLHSLSGGARWTLILVLVIFVGMVFAFGVLFVGFHRLFFEGDSWRFPFSDTFIRLYPERFWRDTFALTAATTILQAALIFLAARKSITRRTS